MAHGTDTEKGQEGSRNQRSKRPTMDWAVAKEESAWPWARTTAAGVAPGTNQPLIVTPSRLGKVMVSYGMPKSDGVSGPGLRAGWTTRRAAWRLKFMTRIVAPMAALAAKVRPSL